MNVVKNPLRNRMSDPVLVSILKIRAGLKRMGKCCNEVSLPPHILRKIGTSVAYEGEVTVVEGDEIGDIPYLY